MKTILGLDLGTNSIGWALISQDFTKKEGEILGLGSRIIPMSQDILGDFGKGNSISQTAERTGYRGVRRLRERHLLRRERLHRVLNVLGFLPIHYADQIDFILHFGKFKDNSEPKLAYHNNEFIFKNSFNEMLDDFKIHQPQLTKNEKGEQKLIPYDWTIYYLRQKAVEHKIEKEELAWLLIHFNQKRGYYQLRGEEEEENPNKLVEFHSLKVANVIADEPQKGKSDIWYSIILENDWIYRRSSKTPLFDWIDKIKDFIVTTDLEDDGTIKTNKDGEEKRSFRAPSEDDWTLVKKKTENEIIKSNKTVGKYIYDTLLQNPKQKIKGKLVKTIERKFYKEELKAILKKQKEYHPELQNEDIYADCVRELYSNNDSHQTSLKQKDITHLLADDIIFYQRPLKSQKSLISNCEFEIRYFKSDGITKTTPLKTIPKSHPLYQEFRLWQWIYNLKLINKDNDIDETSKYLKGIEDIIALYDFLNERKEVEQKGILKHFKLSDKTHRWNFVEDKKYPCNETKTQFISRLANVCDDPAKFLTAEIEENLWHIIYSVNDKIEYEKALKTFAIKTDLDVDKFVDSFKKFAPFKSDYGAYSTKAIKKLLPLIRLGKYWHWEDIDPQTKKRIANILSGEFDESIRDRVRDKALNLTKEEYFQGLPLWLASYIVYDRHSESGNSEKWNTSNDLNQFIKDFKQHSLRNPIVEQVITETLRVVKDIWEQYGGGNKNFFTEIHVELGRDMKNTAEERSRITNQITENENTNLRIKALIAELLRDVNIENVRPYSPTQQEILKIYEDGVLNSNIDIPEDILKISKTAQPTSVELLRYKLWLEQKYRSPYTGKVIPLNKLFTPEYEIEHILPQSRYFDDSFSNKVICEAAVNKLKDNQIGLEFIKNHHGEIVDLGFGKQVKVFSEDEYEGFVKENYAKNRSKKNKLLLEEIPEKMIERQMNDSRYISKYISQLLSNIVRAELNDDGVNSINVLPGNGKITNTLKQDWGLNDVWNELILHRFERLNHLTGTTNYTSYNENHQKNLPTVPLEQSKGFQKKRIDHRHHAVDALIIACATRNHVNLLNNQHANSNQRFDLNKTLRVMVPTSYMDQKTKLKVERDIPKGFLKPWPSFTIDAQNKLETLVVSFKQNLRVINKTTNKAEKWVDVNGIKVKELVPQIKGESWAVRKPMHKDTVSGIVQLQKQKNIALGLAIIDPTKITDKLLKSKIKLLLKEGLNQDAIIKYFKALKNIWNDKNITKVEVHYFEENVASRVSLDISFGLKKIESITDTGIQKILSNYLDKYEGTLDEKGKEIAPELLAFTPEGIEELNNNIELFNDGKPHQPIFKVRTYEPKGNKFIVGQTGNKKDKYVEAAKGTNLFFAIYQDENGKRYFETVALNIVIERQKQGLSSVPELNESGHPLLYTLSPNDLVYIPSNEEAGLLTPIDFNHLNKEQVKRVYKIVSFTSNRLYGIPSSVSISIVNKLEYSLLNKIEFTYEKNNCLKLNVNRIGEILVQY
jgi:CRISPR-associated endonuclease Csn1